MNVWSNIKPGPVLCRLLLSSLLIWGIAVSADSSVIETREMQYQDMKFLVDVAGPEEGDVVILLHGHPQSRHTWRHEMRALAEAGYRAYAPDQRGYSAGARPEGIDAYSPDNLMADVLALADKVDAEKFHLVGHDFGGGVAWITAISHPNRVQSLGMISRPHPQAFKNALLNDSEQRGKSGHHQRFQNPEATDVLYANNLERYRKGLLRSGVPEQDVEAYLEVFDSREAVDAALNWYRAAYKVAYDGWITDPVEVPTLYVWGTNDGSVAKSSAESTGDFVKAPYQFVPVEGAGHFVTDTMPEVFPPLLLKHLARYPIEADKAGS